MFGGRSMPRVPYVQKEAASPEVKKLYEGFETQFGIRGVPNVVKALANSPGLASKVFPLANYFMNQSALDKRVRELAGAIAFWNMMARNLNALQVGLEA